MKRMFARYIGALLVALSYPLVYAVFSPLTLYSTYALTHIVWNPTIIDNTIQFSSASFTFIPACTAATAYILLATLILVTRGIRIKQGIHMFLVGASAIFAMNILRILGLMYIYIEFGKNYFDAVHLIVWHAVSTLFVALVWIVLVEKNNIKSIPVYSDVQDAINKMRT